MRPTSAITPYRAPVREQAESSDPLQHCLEVQALVDAQAGLAEAGQPLPQGLVFPGQLPGILHPQDLRSGPYGLRSPGPPGLRNECISLARNYTVQIGWKVVLTLGC